MRDPVSRARIVTELPWGIRRRRAPGLQLFARAEDAVGRSLLRDAGRCRRLIIPMDGYLQRASRGDAAGRLFAVTLKEDAPLAIAGVWADVDDKVAFALITHRANAAIAAIHDRMPAVLPPERWPAWLGEDPLSHAALATLLSPASPELFKIEEVDQRPRGAGKPEQLRLLGLDAAAVQQPQGRRQRKAAASRMVRECRYGMG